MKAALISVLEREDVLMPRASVWLVGQVTAVNLVGNNANYMYHRQCEDWENISDSKRNGTQNIVEKVSKFFHFSETLERPAILREKIYFQT